MIDCDGYRPNVGIIICNEQGDLLWAKRQGQQQWQFPQGGISHYETPEDAMYRELYEEVGLQSDDVECLGSTHGWLRYRLPKHCIRHGRSPVCIGQKQVWFMLEFKCDESKVELDGMEPAEFDDWCWIDYWSPINQVVAFKREVYRRALNELSVFLPNKIKPKQLNTS